MADKNSLKFSEDGTEVTIIFKSEGETIDSYYSKEDALKAILDLAQKDKIEPGEFAEMRDAILEAKNLPWSKNRRQAISISILGGGGMFGFPGLPLSLMLAISSGLLRKNPKGPVTEAYLDMSEDNSYGIIYGKKIATSPLCNKATALHAVKLLKEHKEIDDAEVEKLTNEINESKLPA